VQQFLTTMIAPTVVAALVSATALLGRGLLMRRGEQGRLRQDKRRLDGEMAIKTSEALLHQVEALWKENAELKVREAESRARCRELERTCADLERRCGELQGELANLRRRLDRFDCKSVPA
jgi:predicted nuclease with TOPRIM domain